MGMVCQINEKPAVRIEKEEVKWTAPDNDWIKINCDGALDSKTKVAGLGVTTRNCVSGVLDGWNRKFFADNVLNAECEAFRDGVMLAVQNKYRKVEFETDSVVVYDMLKGKRSVIGKFIR